ncbi:hypothetical protein E8E11_010867 [Didymella keratinophila]|nr:hypothetical protein E8E11_010867 [Didymella keratinophila]
MASPTKGSPPPDNPPQADPADVGAVAVRSDHWKAIIDFLSVQSSVLNTAVPGHIYGLQAEAHRRYKALEPMLTKYKFPDDLVEVTVTMENGEQQKVRISQQALTAGVNLAGDSNNNDTVEDKKAIEIKGDVLGSNTAQPTKSTTAQESKSVEISKVPSAKQTSPETASSSGTRSSRQSDASKPASNKRAAAASQATTESSEEASPRAASKPKQKAACVSSSNKPQNDVATPATKLDMRNASNKPNRIRVVLLKKPNPFQINQAQEPKSATPKTPKDSNIPEPGKVVKSETFTFVKNSSREQKSFVRPDIPPKSTEPSEARKTYSEAASAAGQKSADAGTKVDIGPHAVLKDKTNKGKAPPKAETKASAKTRTDSQPTKPANKQKEMTADGKIIAVDLKPVTAKRPRSSDDAHTNERPTKKLATKKTPVLNIDVGRQPEATAEEDISPGLLSSPTEAEKTPSSINLAHKKALQLFKPDEAPTSARAKDASTKQEAKASRASRRTPFYGPDAPEERKGVAKVVRKAPKRARDRADAFIDDTSDKEVAKPKRKVKKAKRRHDEDAPQRASVDGSEENDEVSTYAPRKLRTVRKSRAISSSPTKSVESRGSEEDDEKYKSDKSLAKENKQNGLVLDEPRQRRTLSSAPSTPSTSSSSPHPTGPLKQTKTSTSSSTPEPTDAPSSATASPRPTTATSESTTSVPIKRKQDDSSEDSQPPKKRKATRQDRVIATALPRPSPAERQAAEEQAKNLMEERNEQPQINYSKLSVFHARRLTEDEKKRRRR